MKFILNNNTIDTSIAPTSLLLDFVRYNKNLTGTKIGCREGDCGACTVLIGEIINGSLQYTTATSCLTPIGNVIGKHVVSIEGINLENELTAVQQAMHNESATQCGFCTPGFIMSLVGFCLSNREINYSNAIASIDGNICRCTGYKPIERAAKSIADLLQNNTEENHIKFLISNKIIPNYFETIEQRLNDINNNNELNTSIKSTVFLGGGTDLYVQKHEEMLETNAILFANNKQLQFIKVENNVCTIGAATTVTQMQQSVELNNAFHHLQQYVKLISSTPIRNIATIAGNLANASPIGDLTVFFLALNASITLSNGSNQRTILLSSFYTGYKQLSKTADEYIVSVEFDLPNSNTLFNFEKVCKRTHLDIASVNTAICLQLNNEMITSAFISAGGVAAIPMQLKKASEFLLNKKIDADVINECIAIAITEVAPISDARGTKEYKLLLLSQLIKSHFISISSNIQIESLM